MAETTVHMTAATRGPRGGVELAGVDAGGAFDVRIQLLPITMRSAAGLGSPSQDGTSSVGPCAICFRLLIMEALCAPTSPWRQEFGPVVLGRIPMPLEPVSQLPSG
jgi:hypothetical protein